MAYSNKLCNPTPFDVSIPYEKGVSIKVPADSSVTITAGQAEDYREGKPGSEEVRKTLHFYGVFLLDTDLSYDFQALRAIRASIREKSERCSEFSKRLQAMARSQGDEAAPAAIQRAKEESGIARLEAEVELLKKRADRLAAAGESAKVRDKLDPERTCFVLNPPKEFATPLALEIFLDENPEIREKHEALKAKMFGAGKVAKTKEA